MPCFFLPSKKQTFSMDDEPDRLSNHLLEYDPNTNRWRELAPMKYSKYRCCAVALNNEIFVMGEAFVFHFSFQLRNVVII